MARNTNPKPDIRFIVDVRRGKYSSNRLEAAIYPVLIEDGKIRNITWDSYLDRGRELADLRVEAWMDTDNLDQADFYWGYPPVEYREVYSIDAQRAESMAKTLRSINRKIEALNDKWGRPTDFAGYVSYFAQAVAGTTENVFARKVSGKGWSYDDSEYRWMDVDGLRLHFQSKIKDWKEGKL